jgi:predicted HAD superfamily Cof-like phosphohydrolase
MSVFDDVENFHKVFSCPVGTKKITDPDFIKRRTELVTEEINEMFEALDKGDLVEFFDGCLDSIFTIIGSMVELGLPMQAGWDEVVASNLSKLGTDGKPIYNSVGKVTKGPNTWFPDLKRIIEENK